MRSDSDEDDVEGRVFSETIVDGPAMIMMMIHLFQSTELKSVRRMNELSC